MAFKIVINEPKTRRTYQIEKEPPSLLGFNIGDMFGGSAIVLIGFTLEVTGGSDKDGFPMKPDLEGGERKKLLLAGGPGFNPKSKGQRKRKYVRGNRISENIAQVNMKVVEGEGDIAMMLGLKKEEKPEEKKEEAPKEEVPKEEPKPEEKPEEKKEEPKGEEK